MKKKLYDFSVFNAVTVVLAYGFMMTLAWFSIFDYEGINWIGIASAALLAVSFGFVLWFFVFLAVTVTDKQIRQGHKSILKKNIRMTVEDNRRYRQQEIIFRDRTIDYAKLTKKEIARKQIVVQYFPKYIEFLNPYLGILPEKEVLSDENQKAD